MPTGHSIDIDALHAFLFKKADRLGRIRLKQAQLARELDISKFTMSRLIAKMVDTRRLRRMNTTDKRLNNGGMFVVEDPEVWKMAYGNDAAHNN